MVPRPTSPARGMNFSMPPAAASAPAFNTAPVPSGGYQQNFGSQRMPYGMDFGGGAARGGKWIAGAIKRPGQLHRDLRIPQNQTIPKAILDAAARRKGKVGQRARAAENMRRTR
jgi:hypothetical protein